MKDKVVELCASLHLTSSNYIYLTRPMSSPFCSTPMKVMLDSRSEAAGSLMRALCLNLCQAPLPESDTFSSIFLHPAQQDDCRYCRYSAKKSCKNVYYDGTVELWPPGQQGHGLETLQNDLFMDSMEGSGAYPAAPWKRLEAWRQTIGFWLLIIYRVVLLANRIYPNRPQSTYTLLVFACPCYV